MKINENFQVPYDAPPSTSRFLYDFLRPIAKKLNGVAGGIFTDLDRSATSAPTTGQHAQGDFIANSNRVEAGSSPNKYVLMGWVCVASGEPGTWVEARALTGN